MKHLPKRLFSRYGVAASAVGTVLVVKLLLDSVFSQDVTPFRLFLAAVVVGAFYGGLGPGLFATALAVPVVGYFFLSPAGSFAALGSEAVPLALFVLEGVLVSALVAALRGARERTEENAREAQEHREELRESEERFRLIVEGTKDYAIYMLDPEGNVASWNEGARRIKGYDAREIVGRHFSLFFAPEDVRRGRPEEELRIAAEEGRYEEQNWRVRKDGSRFWADVVLTALRDEETGRLRGFSKLTRDATERKRAEEALRQSEERYRTVVRHAAEGIFLVDAETGYILETNVAYRDLLGYTAQEILGMTLYDVVAHDKDSVDSYVRQVLEEGSGFIGQRRHRRKDGSLIDVEVGTSAISYDGRAVLSVVVHDVTERKRAEEERRRSEERYRAVVEQAREGIFLFDAETKRVLEANPAFQKVFGYDAEELAQMTVYDLAPVDPGTVDRNVERTLEQGNLLVGERRYRSKDGTLVDVEVSGSTISYGGKQVICSVVRDVTERKRAEEVLRQSEAALASAQRIAHLGSWERDPRTGELVWSDETYRIFGLAPGEPDPVPYEVFWNAVHPDDRALLDGVIRAALHEGKEYDTCYRLVRPDGEVRCVNEQAEVILDDAGRSVRMLGTVHDVTERERAEEERRRSEERFRALVQNASDVITILEADGTIRYESPAIERVLGYRPDELVGENAFDYVHPDDRERAMDALAEAVKSGVNTTVQFRFSRKDGSWCHLESIGSNLLEDPSVRGIVVNSRDVTERKRVEEKLRQQAGLLNLSYEPIFAWELGGGIVYWNRGSEELYGFSKEEALGHESHQLLRTVHPMPLAEFEAMLKRGGQWVGELEHSARDGRPVTVESRQMLVDAPDGRRLVLETNRDVTERKRAEEKLRSTFDSLLALYEAGQVLGSTLSSEEVVTSLLRIMRGVSGLTAAVISVADGDGVLRVWRTADLDALWPKARYAPEAVNAREMALKTGERRRFRLRGPDSQPRDPTGLCLPLKIRERVVGVLEAYGPEGLAQDDAAELLSSLAAQAAGALENARLYEELTEREQRLHDLVGKVLTAQEEERRRVAYEVHDGLAQTAAAALQLLHTFARRHPPASEKAQRDLTRALGLVQATVGEARQVIADLRPTVLDDFGLSAAIRAQVEKLGGDHRVDYDADLGDERLPATVEVALFRVAQEALNNIGKHAPSAAVSIELRRLDGKVRLRVRDRGPGFDPQKITNGAGPGERVGLSSMRERVALLGGRLEVSARPGEGTEVAAEVPLPEGRQEREGEGD
ncbi:MAG: PAS domain S-box protein [Actinomycetota bacterium]|nr:PAS domain S-box protein [Actinomycetota bacterium]